MKTETDNEQERWRRLYELAAQIKDLAPWEWMEEGEIFGVQNPAGGEVGYVSVMGMAGEHFAVTAYRGANGLYGFMQLSEMSGEDMYQNAQMLYETPQLMLSWEDRDATDKVDRERMKSLGLKFRGKNAWPLFRMHDPGMLPWHFDRAAMDFMTVILEQVLEMAPRVEEDPALLSRKPEGGRPRFLHRVPKERGGRLEWVDEINPQPEPPGKNIAIEVSTHLIETVKAAGRPKGDVQVDLFMFAPIHERDSRPYFSYNLLVVESRSGMILGFEMLKPLPDLETMWSQVPEALLKILASRRLAPAVIRLRPTIVKALTEPVADVLGFKIVAQERLPALDEAKRALLSSIF